MPSLLITSPETITVAIVAGVIGFLAGYALGRPRKSVVKSAVNAAFKVRDDEAEAHGRKKISPALNRARLAVLSALEKLKLV